MNQAQLDAKLMLSMTELIMSAVDEHASQRQHDVMDQIVFQIKSETIPTKLELAQLNSVTEKNGINIKVDYPQVYIPGTVPPANTGRPEL